LRAMCSRKSGMRASLFLPVLCVEFFRNSVG
jgi:hypothetical protein